MVVGEIPEAVDLLVVGGGPGGYVAAIAAARAGRSVVLVDENGSAGLGGVCVSVGCIPSKALIELADRVHQASIWQDRGAPSAGAESADLEAFQAWKTGVTSGLSQGVGSSLGELNVEVRTGRFRFTRPDQGVLAADPAVPPTHLQFASCVIATGSRPKALSSLPFDGDRVLDSTSALGLNRLPSSLAIVGGGYIGIELGTAYAKLGVNVTIIEAQDRLLPTLPPAVHRVVSRRLAQLGVAVRTSTAVEADDGSTLTLRGVAGPDALSVEKIVVAIGRTPNTDDLGLEVLGVTADDRGLLLPKPDRLVAESVAAIGDVTPGPALAHKASAEALVAVEALCGGRARFDPVTIPSVIFSDPEVAQVGMTTADTASSDLGLTTAAFPLSASGRARTLGESAGFFEWTFDREGIVRGALIVGPAASELIAAAGTAIEMGAHLEDIAGIIHAHPTLAESAHEAALVALGRPIHVPARH